MQVNIDEWELILNVIHSLKIKNLFLQGFFSRHSSNLAPDTVVAWKQKFWVIIPIDFLKLYHRRLVINTYITCLQCKFILLFIQSLSSWKLYLSSRWQCPGGSTPDHPWPRCPPGGRGPGSSPCDNAGSDQSQYPHSEVHTDLWRTNNNGAV